MLREEQYGGNNYNIGEIDGNTPIKSSDALISDDGIRVDYVLANPPFGNKSSISEEELQIIKNSPYVNYLGQINVYEELYKYDILIQPSHHEGLSRILLESMYAGLFCICNDIPGIREIIMKTNFGILINNNDIESYIDEIENFNVNPDLSNYDNAKNIKNSTYSVEAIAENFNNLYDEFA